MWLQTSHIPSPLWGEGKGEGFGEITKQKGEEKMKTEKTFLRTTCLRLMTAFLLLLFWALNVNGQSGEPPPPPVAPLDPYEGGGNVVDFRQGKITFTQAGKETTWKIMGGQATIDQGAKRMAFKYSPDGKVNKSYLSMHLKGKGSAFEVTYMRIKEGPAGSAEYNKKTAACTANVTTFSAAGIEGSGTCTGEFKNGPAVARFQFSASP